MNLTLLTAIANWPLPSNADNSQQEATKSNWEVSTGVGFFYGSKVKGISGNSIQPLPLLEIIWKDWIYFNPLDGLGIIAYEDDDFSLDFSISTDLGRTQNTHSRLNGLGDIGPSTVFNSEVSYFLGPVRSFLQASKYLDGTKGNTVDIGGEIFLPLGLLTGDITPEDIESLDGPPRSTALLLSLSGSWGDKNHNQGYWGVNNTQANRSSYEEHNVHAGFHSWEASLGIMEPISEQWNVMLNINYQQVIGDAANSPYVNTEENTTVGIMFRYEF